MRVSHVRLGVWALLALIAGCYGVDSDPLVFTTTECQLTEPVYGHKFDFTALHSDTAHLAKSEKGDTFEYNLCGNLSRSCDGHSNVAACLRRGDKEYILGTQHQLNYRRGRMYFNFTNGAKCPGREAELKLFVFIGCDYTLDAVQSQVTSYANDACTFYITLETPYACLPAPEDVTSNACSVKDPSSGHTYDLLPLSDYNYRTTDRKGNAFVINVCKPVLYAENAMCPADSSVCFIDLSSNDYKKKFFNYGTVQASPTIENGQLIMRHTSNTHCNDTDNYSSIIHFYCDRGVKNAHPTLIGERGCVYEFSFITPLACNNLAPCTTITHGNELLDMSPLQDKPFTLRKDDKSYTFAVCSHAGAPCMENDGACLMQNNQTTSLGSANSQLRVNQSGSPYLLYTGGAQCQPTANANNNSNNAAATYWTTKIEFVCGNNATKDNASTALAALQPKIVENTKCQLLIQYQTPLACQEQIKCKAKVYVEHSEDGTGEEVVDLTPLISETDNYEAQINWSSITEQQVPKSTKFFLNVCRPLVPKFGLGCPGGSAACIAKVDATSPTPEEERSLGYPLASLVAINRTTAELRYLKGGNCPTDKNSQLSTGIVFFCDMRMGRGSPVLQSISDCHYKFSWATNVICPPHMCNFNADTCEIINDEININYNLKKAPFTSEGKIKIQKEGSEFTLDICAQHSKAVTDYSQGVVNLYFEAKGACGVDGLVNVQMRLICSSDNERATSFSDDKQCNLVYVQRTPDICKFLGLTVPPTTTEPNSKSTTISTPTTSATPTSGGTTASSNANDSAHPAERTGSIGAILGAILSLTCVMVCVGIFAFSPERRNSVRRLFRRSSSAVRYSRVQSNEEANLLLESNGAFTDSDDDMLL